MYLDVSSNDFEVSPHNCMPLLSPPHTIGKLLEKSARSQLSNTRKGYNVGR